AAAAGRRASRTRAERMPGSRVTISGGCHCRAVRFEAQVPSEVEVLDCNCSICAMTGFRHLIVPHEDFRLLSGEAALVRYRFGTGAAEHLFCSVCGVKSFYQPRSHPEAWSLNLNALDGMAGLSVTIREFDGRNWEEAREAL
ncbi:MAG: GFA family protein, partial [Allosphingosinicella sp.]